jgi:hypothetical protein
VTVVTPPLRPVQAAAWHALFDLHDRLPTGWALVGGQMVLRAAGVDEVALERLQLAFRAS